MPRSYLSVYYHIVWSTHRREPMFYTDEQRSAVKEYVSMLFGSYKCVVYEASVMPDHVHIAVYIPPTESVSKIIGLVKGASSHEMNKRGIPVHWQDGYGLITFAHNDLESVRGYISSQIEHHAGGKIWQSLEHSQEILP
ncbi:MAG: IS200/IS605 family transposase [Armatimonadota bacterium]